MSEMHARIGKVAIKIFRESGVEGVTMRRIADRLGVTPTTIYRHFANKDEVVQTIVDDGFAILERKLDKAYKNETGLAAIKSLLRCYLDFSIEFPRHFDLMFLSPRADARRFPSDFRNRKSAAFNLLLDLVSAMVEHGELRNDDALEISMTIWAQTHGFATLYRAGRFGDDRVRIRAILDRAIQRLIQGLAMQ